MMEVTNKMRTVARNKSKDEAAELVDYHKERAEKYADQGDDERAAEERAWARAFGERANSV